MHDRTRTNKMLRLDLLHVTVSEDEFTKYYKMLDEHKQFQHVRSFLSHSMHSSSASIPLKRESENPFSIKVFKIFNETNEPFKRDEFAHLVLHTKVFSCFPATIVIRETNRS